MARGLGLALVLVNIVGVVGDLCVGGGNGQLLQY